MADSDSSESAITTQTGPVQSTITAHTGGVAVVPQLHSCHIEGSVNINVSTSSAPVLKSDICIKTVSEKLKSKLRKTFGSILEGIAKKGTPTLLNDIYTKLYILEGEKEGINHEHEVWDFDSISKSQSSQDTPIDLNDIFKPLPNENDQEEEKDFRIVLTKGIAGIGKTVSVHKFILDWAEEKANEDVDLMIVLPFRDLNTMIDDDDRYSLQELLEEFCSELKDVKDPKTYENFNIVFIFDGLDESRLPLDFHNNKRVSKVTKRCSVDELITNLIQSDRLLPSARIWITSRPAAIHKVSNWTQTTHRLTEIQGFSDPQKEEYFRKKIHNDNLADRVISHIKTSRSLHIMCHIPVFCWISATVLSFPEILDTAHENIPTSLTTMYTRFLLYQMQKKNEKYYGKHNTVPLSETDMKIILKLGKLAFANLEEQNLVFSESDLRKYEIDVTDVSVHSGVFTEVVKEEDPMFRDKWYSFVHLTIQEYLAAFYTFYQFVSEGSNPFPVQKNRQSYPRVGYNRNTYDYEEEGEQSGDTDTMGTLHDLHKAAIGKALKSTNGHLDLFLRFLLGLSVDESLWRYFKLQTTIDQESIMRTSQLIKTKLREDNERELPSPERCINLIHCLTELKDNSLVKEIQNFMKNLSDQRISPALCTTLAYMITTSNEVMEEFDLRKYNTSREGRKRLIPVIGRCIRAKLCGCELEQDICDTLAEAMEMPLSQLKILDLSYNPLTDAGVEKILKALLSKKRDLETLRLCACHITETSCVTLAKVLQQSSLRELDLSGNTIGDEGVKLVCTGLMSPHCRLSTLGLKDCNLYKGSCAALASVLWSFSELKGLDLSDNDLPNAGLRRLSAGLRNSNCSLHVLRMSGCQITERGCALLASTLIRNPHHLEELDLSYNHPGESGVQLLSARLEDQHCHLQKLNMDHVGERHLKWGFKKYAVDLKFGWSDGVDVSQDLKKATRRNLEMFYSPFDSDDDDMGVLAKTNLQNQVEVQCFPSLSGERFYWEVDWTGMIFIGMKHKSAGKRFGFNPFEKYFLTCSRDQYVAFHNDRVSTKSMSQVKKPNPDPQRIGVFLDWPAGILSFYSVSSGKRTFLHTFHTTFSAPVVPFFSFAKPHPYDGIGSVTLRTF
ncbi:NACHT, LRR and PYD domains-containing protein 12-like [Alosa sapidissima]|uniref:NACHT, LRR and PYD domains-containing protein 12-like n=1 Tax=Alosa sapidissima TaxID=34773 RepID=UPI001C0882E4|nr:NACHT, LRR and PYD domains-containing protein 12-like [Alosa sapidissima]